MKEVLDSYRQIEEKKADSYTSVLRQDYIPSNDAIKENHQLNEQKMKENLYNTESLFEASDCRYIELTHKSRDFCSEVDGLLHSAKNQKQEGLMIKASNSSYLPGNRRFWLKYKSKFEEGEHETLDLVVLGVYNGTGKRDKVFGSFLLGSYDPELKAY